jgi:peroxiredoxin
LPHLIDLYRKHREAGLQVLVVSKEPADLLADFAKQLDIPFPVLSDADETVWKSYGVGSIPFTLVIDRDGKIATGLAGYSLSKFQDELVPAVEELLKD